MSDATPNQTTAEQLSADLAPVLITGEAIIKSGRTTTEFWIASALVAGILCGVFCGRIDGNTGATLATVISGMYVAQRGALKAQAESNAAAQDKGGVQ